MVYKWYYRTPSGFDDMIMNSDGEYLIGYGGGIKNKAALLTHEQKYI